MRNRQKHLFPMFVDISGWQVLVVGGGSIAERRIRILLEFGASVTVVAPELSPELVRRKNAGEICCKKRSYQPGDLKDTQMVLAATDDHRLNASIAGQCRERKIPVNVCSDQSLCDFQFPSVVIRENLTVGINAAGSDHKKVKVTRQSIEACLGGEHIYE